MYKITNTHLTQALIQERERHLETNQKGEGKQGQHHRFMKESVEIYISESQVDFASGLPERKERSKSN